MISLFITWSVTLCVNMFMWVTSMWVTRELRVRAAENNDFSFKVNRVLGGSLYMGSWIDSWTFFKNNKQENNYTRSRSNRGSGTGNNLQKSKTCKYEQYADKKQLSKTENHYKK